MLTCRPTSRSTGSSITGAARRWTRPFVDEVRDEPEPSSTPSRPHFTRPGLAGG
ncbi:hypothetical protein HBB16_02575 [Pseudonocardia sp. MCCB 268]|nr:hypothetical protein [Pseudonocardia cytotoxica]